MVKNLDLRIAGRYRLQRKIGGGGFGAVYLGKLDPPLIPDLDCFETHGVQATDVKTGKDVAVKLEHMSIDPSYLETEADLYRTLAGGAGIPRVHAYESECEYEAMVFDLLGPSLEDLFNFCGRQFSLKTVLMLADQLLYRLGYIHSKGFIHRDVKPENLLMGTGKQGNQVYVTDLGLATERRATQGNTNDGDDAGQSHLIGSAYYASVNGHLGVVQHRGDDLESLGYMLLYFLRGSLPWHSHKTADFTQYKDLTLERKRTISTDDLCEGLPGAFAAYFRHIRSLGFDHKPNYVYLRKIFRNLFVREGFSHDHVYDWTILKFLMASQRIQV